MFLERPPLAFRVPKLAVLARLARGRDVGHIPAATADWDDLFLTGYTVYLGCYWSELYAMRIAFLTHYAGLYGANRSLLDLIGGLEKYGVEACVIVPRNGEIVSEMRRRGIEVHTCHLGRWVSAVPKPFSRWTRMRRLRWKLQSIVGNVKSNVRAFPALVQLLRTWRPDIVYSNSSLLLSGATAAKYLGVPHIWHLREFGDLDYGFAPDLGHRAQKWLISRSDGVIANSESILAHYKSGSGSRIHIVNSGVAWASDFDRLRTERQNGTKKEDTYNFALVGVLHPAKGQTTAIRAVHYLVQRRRSVRLVLAGSGERQYRLELEKLVRQFGLNDYIEFRGYTDDVFTIYRNADAVLMCSTNEAMGRVTAEAMAACRPVIGYRGGGTEEIVKHEETGLLYEGGSEALAVCMERLARNPAWARKMGENGWHHARDRFTIERCAASVFQILCEVASRHGSTATDIPPRYGDALASASGRKRRSLESGNGGDSKPMV